MVLLLLVLVLWLREENGSAWGCWKKGRRRKIETREREREKGKEKKERKKKKLAARCHYISLYARRWGWINIRRRKLINNNSRTAGVVAKAARRIVALFLCLGSPIFAANTVDGFALLYCFLLLLLLLLFSFQVVIHEKPLTSLLSFYRGCIHTQGQTRTAHDWRLIKKRGYKHFNSSLRSRSLRRRWESYRLRGCWFWLDAVFICQDLLA